MRSIVLNLLLLCIKYGLGVFCILILGGLADAYSESSEIMSIIYKCFCFSFDNAIYFLVLHYIALNAYIFFLERKISRLEINQTKNAEE